MDFALPEVGEGVYEAELIRWLVQPGETVKRGQPLAEVMTDKATMEVPAPFAGRIMSLSGEPGAKLKVGQAILTYQPPGSKADVPAPVAQRAVSAPAMAAAPATKRAANGNLSPGGPIPVAAPSVRHLARKLGIDLSRVRGTGPAGRILIDDLSAQIARPDGAEKARPAHPVPASAPPRT